MRLQVPKCPAVAQRWRMRFHCVSWLFRVSVYKIRNLTHQPGAEKCGTELTGGSGASGGADG